MGIRVDKQVLRFNISMANPQRMDISQRTAELVNVELEKLEKGITWKVYLDVEER